MDRFIRLLLKFWRKFLNGLKNNIIPICINILRGLNNTFIFFLSFIFNKTFLNNIGFFFWQVVLFYFISYYHISLIIYIMENWFIYGNYALITAILLLLFNLPIILKTKYNPLISYFLSCPIFYFIYLRRVWYYQIFYRNFNKNNLRNSWKFFFKKCVLTSWYIFLFLRHNLEFTSLIINNIYVFYTNYWVENNKFMYTPLFESYLVGFSKFILFFLLLKIVLDFWESSEDNSFYSLDKNDTIKKKIRNRIFYIILFILSFIILYPKFSVLFIRAVIFNLRDIF